MLKLLFELQTLSNVFEHDECACLLFGVGVERTFPVHSPIIEKIEVVTKGDVRRAKLYYMRALRGKAAKIKEKRDFSTAK